MQAQAQALAQTRADLDQARAQLAESERNGSAADERAMAVLEQQAGAHKDVRGEVITLPGSLLFQTGKSELSQSARARLDTVAAALKRAPDKVIVVEGYTDDTGTDAVNLPLSKARAEEVRTYLISRGVPEAKIVGEGFRPDASHREQQDRGGARHQPPRRDCRAQRRRGVDAAGQADARREEGEGPGRDTLSRGRRPGPAAGLLRGRAVPERAAPGAFS